MTSATLPQAGPDQQIPSLQRLMAGLIDYAGLFPPSELPLEQAIHDYAGYRVERDSWMLSRFIIPAQQLQALQPFSHLFEQQPPFRFSVVIKGGDDYASFLDSFRGGLAQIHAFEQEHGDRVRVELIETRMPVSGNKPDNPERMLPFFETLERAVFDDLDRSLDVFFEVPWQLHYDDAFNSTYDDLFDHVTTAIQWYNKQPVSQRIHVGVKLRCGGLDPEKDVPSPEIVANLLWHVIYKNVPFKATAGLHHPVRQFREEYGGMMHGFLNVFGAGILGKVHKLDQKKILEIVAETNPNTFAVFEDRFVWHNLTATLDDIEQARADQFISYGSCSFDEPREDLVKLNLLS